MEAVVNSTEVFGHVFAGDFFTWICVVHEPWILPLKGHVPKGDDACIGGILRHNER